MEIAMWVTAGAVAGWLSGKLMKHHGYSSLMDTVMGVTGAVVGGGVLSAMGGSDKAGLLPTTLMAIQGAILLTVLMALASGKKRLAWASETVPNWRHSKGKGQDALSQSRETD